MAACVLVVCVMLVRVVGVRVRAASVAVTMAAVAVAMIVMAMVPAAQSGQVVTSLSAQFSPLTPRKEWDVVMRPPSAPLRQTPRAAGRVAATPSRLSQSAIGAKTTSSLLTSRAVLAVTTLAPSTTRGGEHVATPSWAAPRSVPVKSRQVAMPPLVNAVRSAQQRGVLPINAKRRRGCGCINTANCHPMGQQVMCDGHQETDGSPPTPRTVRAVAMLPSTAPRERTAQARPALLLGGRADDSRAAEGAWVETECSMGAEKRSPGKERGDTASED